MASFQLTAVASLQGACQLMAWARRLPRRLPGQECCMLPPDISSLLMCQVMEAFKKKIKEEGKKKKKGRQKKSPLPNEII